MSPSFIVIYTIRKIMSDAIVTQSPSPYTLTPYLHAFFDWFRQAILLVLDWIIVPMVQQVGPVIRPLLSGGGGWFIPFAVIGWYGPQVILVGLNCILAVISILVGMKQLCTSSS
jgi:hypothetical protein